MRATTLPHRLSPLRDRPTIALAGCGGTGSLLAEHLCRLLVGTPADLVLIDPDTVEERNLMRQNFRRREIGRNKAQALAVRLAGEYRRPIGYHPGTIEELWNRSGLRTDLLLCCTDQSGGRAAVDAILKNDTLRHRLSDHMTTQRWVVDAGNGRDSGQVLIGNHPDAPDRPQFEGGYCRALPSPCCQQPALLAPAPAPWPGPDAGCARALELSEQGPLVNAAMAVAAAEVAHRILTGRCRTMAVYLDLLTGRTQTVPATPQNAARAWGIGDPTKLTVSMLTVSKMTVSMLTTSEPTGERRT